VCQESPESRQLLHTPQGEKLETGGQVGCVRARSPLASAWFLESMAAGVQNYFAVPDFSVRDAILTGILDHVSAQ
jgi:hypothetical protein